jgi:CRISPR system Cascade subunit CasE
MPYLSRLHLNPSSWAARRDLGNDYQLHSTLSRAIAPVSPGATGDQPQRQPSGDRERLLFRLDPVDGQPTILVQSLRRPDWSFLDSDGWRGYLAMKPEVKEVSLQLAASQLLRFRLRANPTRKTTRAGRKVRDSLLSLDAQLHWLQRKLNEAGAELVDARAIQEGLSQSRKHDVDRDGPKQTLFAVRFEGILRVLDPELLQAKVEAGFGSGKGYGFGLLSLAPA